MPNCQPDKVKTPGIADEADFSIIRYAQCWEDADTLLEGLDVQRGDICLSVASGGDNSFSILTREPAKVFALDLSPAQLACVEIKAAGYRALSYDEFLEFMGGRESDRRMELYERLRPCMSSAARVFWDGKPDCIRRGFGSAGRFERYLGFFRSYILPLIHGQKCVDSFFQQRSPMERKRFYNKRWNNFRWRLLMRIFCSRWASSSLGRDKRFFRYADGPVSGRVLEWVEHGLTDLDPSENPYLHWIAYGCFPGPLPHALRPENFAIIRQNLDRLEIRLCSVDDFLREQSDDSIDRFNMSDVFEYMSEGDSAQTFEEIGRVGRRGGRVAYWNTFVSRQRPGALAGRLRPLGRLAEQLYGRTKTFFYSHFLVDEVV